MVEGGIAKVTCVCLREGVCVSKLACVRCVSSHVCVRVCTCVCVCASVRAIHSKKRDARFLLRYE